MDANLILQVAVFAAIFYFMMRGCGGMAGCGGKGGSPRDREGEDAPRPGESPGSPAKGAPRP